MVLHSQKWSTRNTQILILIGHSRSEGHTVCRIGTGEPAKCNHRWRISEHRQSYCNASAGITAPTQEVQAYAHCTSGDSGPGTRSRSATDKVADSARS